MDNGTYHTTDLARDVPYGEKKQPDRYITWPTVDDVWDRLLVPFIDLGSVSIWPLKDSLALDFNAEPKDIYNEISGNS